MRKKSLLKGMAVVLASSAVLTGCAGEGNQKGANETKDKDSGKEETIKVMVWDRGDAAPGTTSEDNEQTKWIQQQVKEKLNLNVKFVAVPRSSSDDKLNIMMSGGSAPDIVFSYGQDLFSNYASNGGLADLSEAYKKEGKDIAKYVGDVQDMGVIDGKQFAIMKQRGEEKARHTAYIRKDWLDALGMNIPKTKEELEAYLKAVKEKNPGNVENVIPWAMSGRNDTEKGYLNFLGSYVDLKDDKEGYMYNEGYMAVASGAEEGLKKLNEWYNEGLISKDFSTDTTEDIYKAQVTAGNVGFILDDTSRPWEYIEVLNNTIGHETFVPVECFDLPDGSYRDPYEPRFGMFVMIPKTSEDKVDACMKYLNWQADPEVAENIIYTKDHQRDENGVPKFLSQEELSEKGYPGTCDDLNIVNLALDYTNDKEAIISKCVNDQSTEWESKEWFENYYDVCEVGKYRHPTYPYISEDEANYGKNITDTMIEYVYKCISCPTADFDKTQKEEYAKLESAGLKKVLDAREKYYDSIEK